ncbi:MAG: hypothetical protein NWF09_02040 [Candidatus Bathyarchaeota archaeon]|nr:hypothetical protein [Candidatus Bathyarchaeota archaeon]
MNVNAQTRAYKLSEGVISAISVGAVLILIGTVFVLAQPNSLWDSIVNFFKSFTVRSVPGTDIYLPAPANTAVHGVLYTAAFQFCLGLGILQILLLMIRLAVHSPVAKTAETVGNLVFWFGAAYLIMLYLSVAPSLTQWFMFWASLLIMLGLSFFARALVLLPRRK